MDKKLQYKILNILIKKEGKTFREVIIEEIKQDFFNSKIEVPNNKKIEHQIDLLIDEKAIESINSNPTFYYRLTPWGHKKVEGGISKIWFWLIYKNNNIYSFLAFIISVIALIISIIPFLLK
ncbi:MAG: hypothetical protein PHN69_03380 [Candidatus Pacebacteria bacterium]|nr:hypothetical protein [Candidatus Paceibacterota bacterium]